MEWYQKAAAQGHPGAINNVGWMNGNGRAGAENGESIWNVKAAHRGMMFLKTILLCVFDGQDSTG